MNSGWLPGLRRLFRPIRRPALEVDEEIVFHIEMRARELEARGLSPDDARAAAERFFGDAATIRAELYARRYAFCARVIDSRMARRPAAGRALSRRAPSRANARWCLASS